MFDISFFELLVVGVVGLIVIGPERLPGTVRTCAIWIGRIKRSLIETRREIEKQIGADEIRRELHNEQVLYNLEKMKDTRLELEAKIRQLDTGALLTGEESSSANKSDAQEPHPQIVQADTPAPQPAVSATPKTSDSTAEITPKH